jgi:hypothetical protein
VAAIILILASAAYVLLRPQPKPATNAQIAITPGANRPVRATSSPLTVNPPVSSQQAEAQRTAQQQRAPLSPTTQVRRRTGRNFKHHSIQGVEPAVQYSGAQGTAPEGVTAEARPEGQALAPSTPGMAKAETAGPGIASTSETPQPAPNNRTTPSSTAAVAPAVPSASAVLLPHGAALLNGKTVSDSTALFPGDRVEVPPGSYASINAKGSLTVLQPGSSAVYTGKGVELRQGGVAVSTLEGMPVETEGLAIAPRSNHGKYDVLDDDGTVQIASLEGELSISDGGKTTVLAEGQQTTRSRRKKAAAAVPPSETPITPGTPPATAGGFPTGKMLIATGVVGGGIAAAVLLTSSSAKPTSPAKP